MGIFDSIKEKMENGRQEKERNRQEKRIIDANDCIEKEKIRCDSDMDFKTIKLIVDSFTKNVSIDSTSSICVDGSYGSMDNDAIGDADANTYHFCKAIISQNFMLMRKIDALSVRLDKIEKNMK